MNVCFRTTSPHVWSPLRLLNIGFIWTQKSVPCPPFSLLFLFFSCLLLPPEFQPIYFSLRPRWPKAPLSTSPSFLPPGAPVAVLLPELFLLFSSRNVCLGISLYYHLRGQPTRGSRDRVLTNFEPYVAKYCLSKIEQVRDPVQGTPSEGGRRPFSTVVSWGAGGQYSINTQHEHIEVNNFYA